MTPHPMKDDAREEIPGAVWRLHAVWIVVVLGLGLAAAGFGAWRHFITVDGLAYLEMAEVYVEEGWRAGTNGYWGPLYPLLLAAALLVVQPPPGTELWTVQGVHVAMYLVSLAAFVFFWREADRVRREGIGERLPAWAFWGIGYLLFLWCTLRLVKIWTMSPDVLVLAAALAAGGFALRIRAKPEGWWAPAGYGAALGLGYLAKAAMFPLAFVFLAGVPGLTGRGREGLLRTGLAALVFLVVAAPFVLTLSAQKERFTFGDSGKLNYARYVNGIPHLHWQGGPEGHGVPAHPTRQIASAPDAFEFSAPVRGTYPPWYDPSYWYEGVQVRFDPAQQLSALVRTHRVYLEYLLLRQGPLLALVAVLLVVGGAAGRAGGGAGPGGARKLLGLWPLWLPLLAAIGMYGLVYVEMRYLVGFMILAWGALLAVVRLEPGPGSARLLAGTGVVGLLVFGLNLLTPNEKALGSLLQVPQPAGAASWYDHGLSGPAANHLVADELKRLGIEPGEEVGFIGYGYYSYWARLAGVRLTAEVPLPQAPGFWEGDEATRTRTLDALLGTGVAAVVTEAPGRHPPPEGWVRLGETAYYAFLPGDRPGEGR